LKNADSPATQLIFLPLQFAFINPSHQIPFFQNSPSPEGGRALRVSDSEPSKGMGEPIV